MHREITSQVGLDQHPDEKPLPPHQQPNNWILNNAYRIIGLSAIATAEEVRQAVMWTTAALHASDPLPTTWDLTWLKPAQRTEATIREAAAQLENPAYRLCQRLFWFHQGGETLMQLTATSSSIIGADWVHTTDPAQRHDGALLYLIRAQIGDPRLAFELRWTQALKYWQRILASKTYWYYFIQWERESGFASQADDEMIKQFRRDAFELVMEGLNRNVDRAIARGDGGTLTRAKRIIANLELPPELFSVIHGMNETV